MLLFFCFTFYFFRLSCNQSVVLAATEEQKEAFRKEASAMILSGDNTIHDISAYHLTSEEFWEIWYDIIEDPTYFIAYNTYSFLLPLNDTSSSQKYASKFWLVYVDNDFPERYKRVLTTVERILAEIDDSMSDLDKALYLHDAVVDSGYYKLGDAFDSCAGGILGNGYAGCVGYDTAYRLLLTLCDIPSFGIASRSLNHQWSYVLLDGEWYHVDCTWDDTRSLVTGEVGHQFFLRNASEFSKSGKNSHGSVWYSIANSDNSVNEIIPSTSKTYSNWFVHDVVGKMYYENRFWYYIDSETGSIVRSRIDGSEKSVLLAKNDSNLSYKIISLANGILSYMENQQIYELNLNELFPYDETAQTTKENKKNTTIFLWNSLSEWRSGQYDWKTGKYIEFASRICLNDYIKVNKNTSYTVLLSDKNCHMLIRELNSKHQFLYSGDFVDGDIFTTQPNTVFLGITLYYPDNEDSTYSTYETLFQSKNRTVGLTSTVTLEKENHSLQNSSSKGNLSKFYVVILLLFLLIIPFFLMP